MICKIPIFFPPSLIQGFGDMLVNHSVTFCCLIAQVVFYCRMKRRLVLYCIPKEIAFHAKIKSLSLIILFLCYWICGILAVFSNIRYSTQITIFDVLYGFISTSLCFWIVYLLFFLKRPERRANLLTENLLKE